MSTADTGEFSGTERFVVEHRVGAGGMGVVYRAYDRQRQEFVAIKTLRYVDAAAIYRLKREFRGLADLVHPNLVSLYELFSTEGEWFFTMEFVEGVHFLRYVRFGPGTEQTEVHWADTTRQPHAPTGPWAAWPADSTVVAPESAHQREDDTPPPPGVDPRRSPRGVAEPAVGAEQLKRLRSALRQLAEAVFSLHRMGKLHRDIKPSNVLVSREGRLVLLDFGLATELAHDRKSLTSQHHIVGTVPYLSPEQAAGTGLSAASDWYSVGVMLYEALTGRRPFLGRPLQVLMDKQAFDPPAPRELTPGVPDDLDALCVGLLRRDPAARPSGVEVLRQLGSRSARQPPAMKPDSLPAAEASHFVGREKHLKALGDAFSATRRGRTVLVYVDGRSGAGKTALVGRFLDQIRHASRTVILSGRCYQRESVPYKALDSLADALSHYLVQLSPLEADALMPRDAAALSHLFPVLRRAEAMARAPVRARASGAPSRQELRERAFGALREILVRLGDRKTLVLHIDDLQWADLDSVFLLNDLLRPPDPPVLLLVACYRSEDRDASAALRAILDPETVSQSEVEVRHVEVGPLSRQEARQLALELLGSDDPAARPLAHAIAEESGGNPFFVDALVRHRPAPSRLADAAGPTRTVSLDEVLLRRADSLPEAARRLLEVVAVAGRPLRQADACQAAGLSLKTHEATGLLETAHMIRTTGSRLDDQIETYHDRIRETVVGHLSHGDLVRCHQSLARALEASGRADPATLAAHFVAAEEPEKGGRCYVVAADQAVDALAFDRAANLYRLAAELLPAGEAESSDLHKKLADALANAGRGPEAAGEYLAAAKSTRGTDALQLRRCAAQQFLVGGHIQQGLAVLRAVLDTVGMKWPETRRRALWSLILRRAGIRLRGLWFRERHPTQISPQDLIRIDTCGSVAVGLSMVDPIRAADFQARCLLLSLRCGEPYQIVRALALEAGHAAVGGGPARRRVAQLLKKAHTLAHRISNPRARGEVALAAGIAACMQGRWKRAVRLCDRAEKVFREHGTGVAWEVDTARGWAAEALQHSGQIVELARRLPSLRAEARRRGNLYALSSLGCDKTLPELAADDPEAAEQNVRESMAPWPKTEFHVQHLDELYALVQIDLYRGRGDVAWRRIRERWPALARSLLLRVQMVRGLMYHTSARCALAAALSTDHPRPLLRAAGQAARRLEREKQPWMEPLAGLVRATIAASGGDTSRAVKLLTHAITRFDAVDMALYAAAARRRLGEILGGDEGAALCAAAHWWMAGQNVVDPARMAALCAPGFPPCKAPL